MGNQKGLVPAAIPFKPRNIKKEDIGMLVCNKHGRNVYFWFDEYDDNRCPACLHIEDKNEKVNEKNKDIRSLKKEIKLLKHELVEERMLHNATKLDAAEYLAQKELVNKLVKDRLK